MNNLTIRCSLWILVAITVACSSESPDVHFVPTQELSKKAMYQDYDTLVRTILEINPQVAVRQRVMGLDIPQRLNELRSSIDTCSTGEFYDLIRQALAVCQDGHAGILPAFFFEDTSIIRSSALRPPTDEAIAITEKYRRYLDSLRQRKKLTLPLSYSNGDYYLVADFAYQGALFSRGMKLTHCNGQPVHDFVKSLVNQRWLRWDHTNRRFYDEDFLSATNVIRKGIITLTFTDNELKKEQEFSLYDSLGIEQHNVVADKEVTFSEETGLLYIRIPEMAIQDTGFYAKEIQKHSGKPIAKVAIDIRGNSGGSDRVGEHVVEMLLDDWFYTEITLLANLSPKVAAYLDEDLSIAETITIPFLNNATYWKIYQNYKNVFPDPRSIRHTGPIYIVQDQNIFSAAGTLAAYAEYSDRIFSVGQRTGRLLGKGTTPVILELPNTHLLFRMEPLLDVSGATVATDVFHDQVEIPVPALGDGNRYFPKEKEHVSQQRLLQQDAYVRVVLEHRAP